MANSIMDLSPKEIWENFYSLTQIPRPSHHEEQIQQFMLNFARSLGLDSERDETGNVIIRKPATAGCENSPKIIMQGHLDMVPQANEGSTHNFATDPIQTEIDGDWITAKGTTLGSDNGIGVAAAMTVLASKDIRHGPIEALFTANEEDGMTGALAICEGQLSGTILLNLDSEEEGVLTLGCAGGVNFSGSLDIEYAPIKSGYAALEIKVRGLRGGHSGVDIHRGRGNANKVLARLLISTMVDDPICICHFDGGSLRNAIPREATAVIAAPEGKQSSLKKLINREQDIIAKELMHVEPNLRIVLESSTLPKQALTHQSSQRLLDMIAAIPHGALRMSDTMPGLVETSTNLAMVKLVEQKVEFLSLLRSSVNSARDDLAQSHQALFRLAGGEGRAEGAYPGWVPNMNSPLLEILKAAHFKVFEKEAEIGGIHAGLECGILSGPMPYLDMISFGPTIEFPHSPDERMHIASVGRFWSLLVEALDGLANTSVGEC